MASQFPSLPGPVVYLAAGICWAQIIPQTVIMVTNSKVQKACEVTSRRDRSEGIRAVEIMLEREHSK